MKKRTEYIRVRNAGEMYRAVMVSFTVTCPNSTAATTPATGTASQPSTSASAASAGASTTAIGRNMRRSVVRFLAPIGLVGGLFAVMMFLYYLQTLPANAIVMLHTHLLPVYARGMVAVFVVTTAYLLFAWWRPMWVHTALAVAVFLFVAIVGVWPEERMRESMRKPYVAGQYIYGNQVIARDVPGKGITGEVDRIADKGLLALHPFVPERLRVVTDDNRLEAGHLLAQIACANCHALERGAPLRSLPDKFHGATDADLIAAYLRGPLKHGMQPYMPRIDLPEAEIGAIAHYLAWVNGAPEPAIRQANAGE